MFNFMPSATGTLHPLHCLIDSSDYHAIAKHNNADIKSHSTCLLHPNFLHDIFFNLLMVLYYDSPYFLPPKIACYRQTIGDGIRLSFKENGDVWVQVYTRRAIFVHSHYLDRESGRSTGDVVHKVYPGAKIKVGFLFF